MRVSSIEGDLGYLPPMWRREISVFLEGAPVKRIIWADEEAEKVCRVLLNDAGRVVVDPDNPDECLTEILQGRVVIVDRNQ